jgi:hypothetical protein
VRVAAECPMSLTEYNVYKAQLDGSEIDEPTFEAKLAKMKAPWSLTTRLAFEIMRARAAGDVPARNPPKSDQEWPDQDWATIVNG